MCLQKIGLGELLEQKDDETPSVLLKNLINCDNIINEFVRDKLEKDGIEGLFKFFQYILQKVNIIHFLANDILNNTGSFWHLKIKSNGCVCV